MKKIFLMFSLFLFGGISFARQNNDDFLDNQFWANNPSDAEIISALYGDGNAGNDKTAYTKYWNVISCNTGNLAVINVLPGIDTLPATLTSNRIYVLEEGDYITTRMINLSTCSAIVGKGEVTLYSSGQVADASHEGILQKYNASLTTNNIILNNLNIESKKDGIGGTHLSNYNGIGLYNSSNNTLYGIKSLDADYAAIRIQNSSYNILESSILGGGSDYGVYYNLSSWGVINNTISYGTTVIGTVLQNSHNVFVNNLISYNNTTYNIKITTSSNVAINNSIFMNVNGNSVSTNSINSIFNNVLSYNGGLTTTYKGFDIETSGWAIFNKAQSFNHKYGMGFGSTTGNTYYGDVYLYQNDNGNLQGSNGNDSIFSPGTGNTLGFGRNTGNLITGGVLDGSKIINIINESFEFLIGNNSCIFNKGKNSLWNTTGNFKIRYGENLPLQENPVKWNGTSRELFTGVDRDPTKPIAYIEGMETQKTWTNSSGVACANSLFQIFKSYFSGFQEIGRWENVRQAGKHIATSWTDVVLQRGSAYKLFINAGGDQQRETKLFGRRNGDQEVNIKVWNGVDGKYVLE